MVKLEFIYALVFMYVGVFEVMGGVWGCIRWLNRWYSIFAALASNADFLGNSVNLMMMMMQI